MRVWLEQQEITGLCLQTVIDKSADSAGAEAEITLVCAPMDSRLPRLDPACGQQVRVTQERESLFFGRVERVSYDAAALRLTLLCYDPAALLAKYQGRGPYEGTPNAIVRELCRECGLEPGEIRRLIHIAHEEGMAVSVHGNGARNVTAAAEAGVDSVEHGAYLDTETLHAMKEAGTVWVPTLSTVANLRGKGRHDEWAVQAIFESFAENLRAFAAMGGLVAAGSDAGAWQVTHGCDTEDGLLAALGIDPTAGNRTILDRFF